jgi:hypothetical protein
MTVQSGDLKIEALLEIEGRNYADWVNTIAASEQALFTDEPLAPPPSAGHGAQDQDAQPMEQAVVTGPAGEEESADGQWDAPQHGANTDIRTGPFSIGDHTSFETSAFETPVFETAAFETGIPGGSRGAELLTEDDAVARPEFESGVHLAGPSPYVVGDFSSAASSGNHGELIFLDFESSAKGGEKGKPKDGGNTDPGGSDPAVLSDYTSGLEGGYNIEIDFKGTWTAELQQAFISSAEWLSSTITGDITDVFFRGKIIDDIRISAELKDIDGSGGILGQAGPTAIRTADYLPATAIMQFDIADADVFNGLGLWDDIVLHEMLHSIGFGSIWGYTGDISGAGTANPLFTGASATLAYEALFDVTDSLGVPVEGNAEGPGTQDSHWDDDTFGNEIMTGYINDGNYMSPMTVASLEDIGYDTVWKSTDPLYFGADPVII